MRRTTALPVSVNSLSREAVGPVKLDQYSQGNHPDELGHGPSKQQERLRPLSEGRTSTGQSILNMVNCLMGAGVLGYPYCFKECGLVLATVIMLVMLLACRFSYQLLLYCSQLSSKRTYEELAEQALGKFGRQVVELSTAALNLGAIVAFLNILADVLSAVAGTIIPPGAEPSRRVYLAGVTLCGALPVALIVRDHSVVAAFCTASVGFIFLFAVVVLVFACWPAAAVAGAGAVQLWRTDGLLVAFPVMAYGFTAHPYYLGIYSNLTGSSIERMSNVTNMAVSLTAVLYWIIGLGGYLIFKNRTAGDLLRNFGALNTTGLRGAYERAIKMCYGLSILGSVPLVILPFYNILLPLLSDKEVEGAKETKSRLSDSESEDAPLEAPALARSLSRKRSTSLTHEVDVVDLRLQHDGIHQLSGFPSLEKHMLVVFLVLGTAMAAAIWLPNVEFIFGLTGATAAVLISYILPALTFIRLLDLSPEVYSGKWNALPQKERWQWIWRRRQAIVLLCFGIVTAITCTDAILSAVKQEAVVVQLAQQLAAHEVVVAQSTRVQQKAKEAVAAVTVAEAASKQISNATNTLDKLQKAAEELKTFTNKTQQQADTGIWGLGAVREHTKHVAETKLLRDVEVTLKAVHSDLRNTMASVANVIQELDSTIAQIRADSVADKSQTQQKDADPGSTAFDRASSLSIELMKALGTYSTAAADLTSKTAGKSLDQVRTAAVGALSALNQTLALLDGVSIAVNAAKKSHKHDDEVRVAAQKAMEAALNATAYSTMALQLTSDALQKSATQEAQELVNMLAQVSSNLDKSNGRTAGSTSSVLSLPEGDGKQNKVASSVSSMGTDPNIVSSATVTAEATSALSSTTNSDTTLPAVVSANNTLASGVATASTISSSQKSTAATKEQLKKVITELQKDLTAAAASQTVIPSGNQGAGSTGEAAAVPLSSGVLAGATVPPESQGKAAASTQHADSRITSPAGNIVSATMNVSSIAQALAVAVNLTKDSQQEALNHITETLGKTDAKTAERVMDILKDLTDTKQQNAGNDADQVQQQQKAVETSTQQAEDNTVGPVVKVGSTGSLVQNDDVTGPIVTDQELQRQQGDIRGHVDTMVTQTDPSSKAEVLNRKLGLGS